jgi:predicted nicotinamide N-methyase
MERHPDPSAILQTATAFWPSKALLSAVGLGLFTALGKKSMTAEELGKALGLHPRGWYDFFDALVALKFLERDGDGPSGRYRNTLDTGTFLDKASPAYIGGIADMMNTRLYRFWGDLEMALKTGKPQNELKSSGKSMFAELYSDPARLGMFLEAMSGFQGGNFMALAEKFDWGRYKTVTDVGGALALLSRVVAAKHKQLTFQSFDLPEVAPHAQKHVDASGMKDRIKVVTGDFLKGDLPKADVVTMGNILHDWDLAHKKILIRKAYEALPAGGAFIAIENVIDDARRENVFGLLMSLNMLIEFGEGGFDYTGADFRGWCTEAGFKRFEFIPLAGPTIAAVAYK